MAKALLLVLGVVVDVVDVVVVDVGGMDAIIAGCAALCVCVCVCVCVCEGYRCAILSTLSCIVVVVGGWVGIVVVVCKA